MRAQKPINGKPARPAANGPLSIVGRATTKRTGLMLPTGMPLSAWRNLGRQIHVISDSSAWWLGDWLIYGQDTYPDRYKDAVAETSLDYQTLRNYAWVARRFPTHRRRERLSFQHHAEVASLTEAEQEILLSAALANGWSRNELRRQIRRRREAPEEPAEVTYVQVKLATSQKQHWQDAAERAETNLLAWIVAVLDHAARSALEIGDLPALEGRSPGAGEPDATRPGTESG